jgi:multidrug efflux pump subunit AcrB
VDDAIIAIEMMVVKMEEGYDRIAASAYAWSHTAAPMLAGTLVTAIGFMPNGFARSSAGEYTSNMFWIVGIALIASWVVAVVFTPYLGVKLLPDFKQVEGGHEALQHAALQPLRQVLGRVIARKWLVAARCRAVRGWPSSAWRWSRSSSSRSPTGPKCWLKCRCPMAPRSATSAATAKVEAWLAKQAEAKIVTAYIGQGAPRFFLAMGRNCPIRRSPRSWSAPAASRSARPSQRWRAAVAAGLAPKRGCASPSWCSALLAVPGRLPRHAGRTRTSCATSPSRCSVMDASPMMRTVNTDGASVCPPCTSC